jgi:hypothetical protein
MRRQLTRYLLDRIRSRKYLAVMTELSPSQLPWTLIELITLSHNSVVPALGVGKRLSLRALCVSMYPLPTQSGIELSNRSYQDAEDQSKQDVRAIPLHCSMYVRRHRQQAKVCSPLSALFQEWKKQNIMPHSSQLHNGSHNNRPQVI